MSWKWYGVKTLYRTEVYGEPDNIDAAYDPNGTLVEERILLFRARSFDEAIMKAESEAKEYSSVHYKNPYNQIVKQRYLKVCDAYVIYDEPATGVEIFSTTYIVAKSRLDKEIMDHHMGVYTENRDRKMRVKFYNAEFSIKSKE